MKFVPGGHATFFGFLNSFVHVPMYLYYFLAAFGPKMQKYLFWKKYLTAFQMVQFVAIFVHSFQLLFIRCDFPKAFFVWIGCHAVLFWFLFSDFYKKSYIQKKALSNGVVHSNGAPNGLHANGNGNGHVYMNGKSNGYHDENLLEKIDQNNNVQKEKMP